MKSEIFTKGRTAMSFMEYDVSSEPKKKGWKFEENGMKFSTFMMNAFDEELKKIRAANSVPRKFELRAKVNIFDAMLNIENINNVLRVSSKLDAAEKKYLNVLKEVAGAHLALNYRYLTDNALTSREIEKLFSKNRTINSWGDEYDFDDRDFYNNRNRLAKQYVGLVPYARDDNYGYTNYTVAHIARAVRMSLCDKSQDERIKVLQGYFSGDNANAKADEFCCYVVKGFGENYSEFSDAVRKQMGVYVREMAENNFQTYHAEQQKDKGKTSITTTYREPINY